MRVGKGYGSGASAASRPHEDEVAIFSLDPIDLISGILGKRQRRLVEAWAELHQAELMADWLRLQAGQSPLPIDPLR
jgi:hypothetical protein